MSSEPQTSSPFKHRKKSRKSQSQVSLALREPQVQEVELLPPSILGSSPRALPPASQIVMIPQAPRAKTGLRARLGRMFGRSSSRKKKKAPGSEGISSLSGPVLKTIARPDPLLRTQVKRLSAPTHLMAQQEVFKAGISRAASRLLIWMALAFRLLLGNFTDFILGRSSIERRATRLRLVLQSGGTTFIKIGQQMSLRIDLLPYQYASELEKMLDRVRPFSSEYAIKCIEESIGGPLHSVFAAFDPVPIGSASMSCVYQGILLSGERVAVKVRRPNVGRTLAADMRALSWMLKLFEFFVLPPGFSDNLVRELREMLLSELDFRMESRAQDIFRRRLRKTNLRFASTPRIYFKLSNHQVIVAEFVSGVWLTDVLAAVESDDQQALAELKNHGIDPKKVARRLLEVSRWGGYEALLFHADMHPANVLVRPKSKLVLIDFGSFGAFTLKERTVWRRLMQAQRNEDVAAMAQAAIGLLEPLPPLDIDELTKRLEKIFWDHLYAYKSKHAEWWERTSAQLWIAFLGMSRELQIPMNMNTLKMIRASMLVDTLALRLDKKVDQYKEFKRYLKGAGDRARKRLVKKANELLKARTCVEVEDLFDAGRGFIYQMKRTVDSTTAMTTSLIGKAAYAMTCMIQFSVVAMVSMLFGLAIMTIKNIRHHVPLNLWHMMVDVLNNWPYQLFLGAAFLVYARRMTFRLLDTDDE